jgi:NitT/TauT family transport system substrate-binding protein
MDQSMKIKDATGKDVYAIKFSDYGINLVSSGVITNTDYLKENPDLVKRFLAATQKSIVEASKHPADAAQAILNANPKGGKIDTLTQGFELTIPLYKDPTGKSSAPLRVSDQNMTDTVNLMVEYGGLDPKAKENPKSYYTDDYLPK